MKNKTQFYQLKNYEDEEIALISVTDNYIVERDKSRKIDIQELYKKVYNSDDWGNSYDLIDIMNLELIPNGYFAEMFEAEEIFP